MKKIITKLFIVFASIGCAPVSSIKAPPGIDIGLGENGKLIARGDPVVGDTLTLKKFLGTGQAFGPYIYVIKDFRIATSKGGELGTSVFLKGINYWYQVVFFPNKTFKEVGEILDIRITGKQLVVFRQGRLPQTFTINL